MIPGLREAVIDDTIRHSKVSVMYPIPEEGSIWGILLPLRDTIWGEQIPTVSGEALSEAFYGNAKMLRGQLGRPPQARVKLLPVMDTRCSDEHQCNLVSSKCHPGSGELPECYVPPVDRSIRTITWAVTRAWAAGTHVFVVNGPEFVL